MGHAVDFTLSEHTVMVFSLDQMVALAALSVSGSEHLVHEVNLSDCHLTPPVSASRTNLQTFPNEKWMAVWQEFSPR
jgi:hypothetical protein